MHSIHKAAAAAAVFCASVAAVELFGLHDRWDAAMNAALALGLAASVLRPAYVRWEQRVQQRYEEYQAAAPERHRAALVAHNSRKEG